MIMIANMFHCTTMPQTTLLLAAITVLCESQRQMQIHIYKTTTTTTTTIKCVNDASQGVALSCQIFVFWATHVCVCTIPTACRSVDSAVGFDMELPHTLPARIGISSLFSLKPKFRHWALKQRCHSNFPHVPPQVMEYNTQSKSKKAVLFLQLLGNCVLEESQKPN